MLINSAPGQQYVSIVDGADLKLVKGKQTGHLPDTKTQNPLGTRERRILQTVCKCQCATTPWRRRGQVDKKKVGEES